MVEGFRTYSNAERLNAIDELVRVGIDKHIAEGGIYYDDTAKQIAQRAVMSCMPEMPSFFQHPVVVDADEALLLKDLESPVLKGTVVEPLDGAHVTAQLDKIELQAVRLTTDELGPHVSLYSYGMFAVLRPAFKDAEPGTIVFGQELYLPLSGITSFEHDQKQAA